MFSNKLVVCPYDEAHKMKESRLQIHITNCRKSHEGSPTFICPFNATHVYPIQEKSYHLSRCSDRAMLDKIIAAPMNQNNPFKGRTAVPSYSDPIHVESDEVWDVEEFYEVTSTKEVPVGGIVEPAPLSKPASRRQLYRDLHQMPTEIDKRSAVASVPAPVPRQPKQPSQAERTFVEEKGTSIQNLGLGRGKVPPVNRIAANIFPQQAKANGGAASSQSNYSAVTSGMGNLSLARGNQAKAPTNQPFLNDDDFPALGLGRGLPKNMPRQELKAPGSRW